MLRALLISCLFLAACDEMADYYPNGQVTVIDNKEYLVNRAANGSYQAFQNKEDFALVIDPMEYVRNVKAIEAVSGCRVIRETIRNTKIPSTIASVEC